MLTQPMFTIWNGAWIHELLNSHMISEEDLFSESEPYIGKSCVRVGNGKILKITRMRSIIFYMNNKRIKINGVYVFLV